MNHVAILERSLGKDAFSSSVAHMLYSNRVLIGLVELVKALFDKLSSFR